MKIVALIEKPAVIERILGRLKPWPSAGVGPVPWQACYPPPTHATEADMADAQGDMPTQKLPRGTLPSEAEATSPPRPFQGAADFGRYHVLEELGRGGMGVVYRAHDKTLGRDIALKVLRVGGRVDTETIERFQREARAAAALDHPIIIKVLDVGRLPKGDLDGAIADCDAALKITPRYAEGFGNRGNARATKGDLAGALRDWEGALRVAPANWPYRATVEGLIREAGAKLHDAK